MNLFILSLFNQKKHCIFVSDAGSVTKKNIMTTSKITKGTRIESNKLVMVVTGETDTAFIGYHEYKGKIVGQCSIAKDMFTNPHYMNNIKITNES